MTSYMLGDYRLHAQYNTHHRYVILLIHEGGPEDVSYPAVARFIASELGSRRAVDSMPRWMWLPVLYGMVLPWRTPRTRKIYEASWLPRGSFATLGAPSSSLANSSWLTRILRLVLMIPEWWRSQPTQQQRRKGGTVSVYHCQELADRVQQIISDVYASIRQREGRPLTPGEVSVQVEIGYTHQSRSLDASLSRVHLLGNYTGVRDSQTSPARVEEEHLIVLPLYPQYSSLRSAAAFDALVRTRFFTEKRSIPHLEFIRSYATHPAYIKAVEMHVRAFMAARGAPDWLFVVFDGLPKRFVLSGDIYQVECQRTYDALKELLAKPFVPPDGEGESHGAERKSNGSTPRSANGSTTASSSSPPSSSQQRHSHLYTQPFLTSRLTVSYLSGPVGVEEVLEPRTTRVLNSIAKQVRLIESTSRSPSTTRSSRSASRDAAESASMRRAMMGTIYFVCPGIVVDDVRSQSLVHNKLVAQSLSCGWERAIVIPSLNASELHAQMLASIVSEYVR